MRRKCAFRTKHLCNFWCSRRQLNSLLQHYGGVAFQTAACDGRRLLYETQINVCRCRFRGRNCPAVITNKKEKGEKKSPPRGLFSLVGCNIHHLPPRRPAVDKINVSGITFVSISLHFLPEAFSGSIYTGGQPPYGERCPTSPWEVGGGAPLQILIGVKGL